MMARKILAISIGLKTKVSEENPNTWLMITSKGASTKAICKGLLIITEKAYSDWPFDAS